MEVSLGVLADYANVSSPGKLNIMGVFDTLFASDFPVRHPIITLVFKIRAGLQDTVSPHRDIQIKLVDEHSRDIFTIPGKLTFQNVAAGELAEASLVMTFQDLVFKEPGSYSFQIYVADKCLKEIPLKVVKITPPPQG